MVDKSAREIFVRNMRKFMEEKNISQADISSQMQLTASTVSDWYNGKNYPRVDAMQRLAALFGVSMRELTTEAEEEFFLSSDERRLLFCYRSLTLEGQEKVLSYVSDIAALYSSEKNKSVPSQDTLK